MKNYQMQIEYLGCLKPCSLQVQALQGSEGPCWRRPQLQQPLREDKLNAMCIRNPPAP